jgi:hypothetical protein
MEVNPDNVAPSSVHEYNGFDTVPAGPVGPVGPCGPWDPVAPVKP